MTGLVTVQRCQRKMYHRFPYSIDDLEKCRSFILLNPEPAWFSLTAALEMISCCLHFEEVLVEQTGRELVVAGIIGRFRAQNGVVVGTLLAISDATQQPGNGKFNGKPVPDVYSPWNCINQDNHPSCNNQRFAQGRCSLRRWHCRWCRICRGW